MRTPVWTRAAAAGLVAFMATGAHASGLARKYCPDPARVSAPRPVPSALVAPVARAFEIDAALAKAGSFYRCAGGRLLVCAVGANLPCGKANVARSLPAATTFCAGNPDAIGIPMAVTGHDTVYAWRCVGRTARAEGPAQEVDAEGYFAEYWKEL